MFKKSLLMLMALFVIAYVYTHYNMKVTDPNFLTAPLSEIEEKFDYGHEIDPKVSKVTVAWHLDHMLKTINEICKALEASNPDAFKASINFSRIISLTLNYIPRGAAQSPSIVLPSGNITQSDLQRQLEEAKNRLILVFELPDNAHFNHPYFGIINRGQALRFIEVHTHHHLKIVRDILK
ncbi:MAG: DUF1569 domain-containing protein [Bacteroidota bacterium]